MNSITSKNIQLEIVSPEKCVYQEKIDYVVLPAFNGEYAVLPGHTHFLCQLIEGELRIVQGENINYFAVSGGFAVVHPDRIDVFAETAEMAKEINSERARLAADRAKQEIHQAASPQDLSVAQAALRRALIRLHVAENRSHRTKH